MMLDSGSETQFHQPFDHKGKQPLHLKPFFVHTTIVFNFQYNIQ